MNVGHPKAHRLRIAFSSLVLSSLLCFKVLGFGVIRFAAAELPEPCPECVLKEFEELKTLVKHSFEQPIACHPGVSESFRSCETKELCTRFVQQADAPYLYVNSRGEKIANYALDELEADARACLKSVTADGLLPVQPGVVVTDDQYIALSDRAKNRP